MKKLIHNFILILPFIIFGTIIILIEDYKSSDIITDLLLFLIITTLSIISARRIYLSYHYKIYNCHDKKSIKIN